jgi:rubrerythrin
MSQIAQRFVKRSSETAALFHHHPHAIYEFRDKIWRVTQMQGNVPANIFMSDAFRRLLVALQTQGIQVQTCTTPKQGVSEVFPMSWYCSNPSCNKFISGPLADRDCPACRSEIRQLPLVVICDACSYLDAIKTNNMACRRCGTKSYTLVMYDRNNLGSWRIVCQTCLDAVLQRERLRRDQPNGFKRFEGEFQTWTDLEPGAPCPNCRAPQSSDPDNPGKRVVPAGSNVVSPAFTTTFDQDVPTIKLRALTTASKEFTKNPDYDQVLDRIKNVFGIQEIYLAEIVALNCTYGYRVGRNQTIKQFGGQSVYLRADQCGAILFEFDPAKFSDDSKEQMLHSIAHALLQVVGYITGLGNEAYREYVDIANSAVMIFTAEAGGCDILVQEPAKLVTWLKQARAVVHDCKNQCKLGCPWCLHLRTFQCDRLNRNLNREGLSALWDKKVGLL